jgi:hypothetical protein
MLKSPALGLRLLALAILAASAGAAQAQLRVSSSGQATVEVPLAVPPGVAGLQPSLSLVYSDGSPNGPLGVGWSLGGLSMVSRCASSFSLDPKVKGVAFDSNDNLCLDGARLVIANGATATPPPAITRNPDGSVASFQSGAATEGTRYFRSEFDGLRRINSAGNLNSTTVQLANGSQATYYGGGPAEFQVTTPDGRTLQYGTDAATLQSVVRSATPVYMDFGTWYTTVGNYGAYWLLSKVVDAAGNTVAYKYAQGGPSGFSKEWVLSEVTYSSGTQAKKVAFEYEAKSATLAPGSDISISRQVDTEWRSQWRLKAVRTYTNAINSPLLAKTYKMAYERSPQTGRSRLTSVTECAGAAENVCQPPTQMAYADNGPSIAYAANGSFAASSIATAKMVASGGGLYSDGAYGVLVGDFNGDGRADIVRWSNTSSENQLWLSNGDGTFALTSAPQLAATALHSSTDCTATLGVLGTVSVGPGVSSYVADFNGDGRADILRVGGCGGLPNLVLLSQGDGQFTQVQLPSGINLSQLKSEIYGYQSNPAAVYRSSGWRFFVLDVNGDGLPDLVTSTLKGYVYETPYGSPPSEASLCSSSDPCNRAYLGSFDAQGNLAYAENASWEGKSWPSLYADPPKTGDIRFHWRPQSVADVNGDGLDDIMSTYTGRWVSANASYVSTTTTGDDAACPTLVDYNGDGAKDCLVTKPNPTQQKLTYSQGRGTPSESTFNLNTMGNHLVEFTSVNGSSRQSVGSVGFDADGDGRDDILRWGPSPSDNGIYLSNGDGSFRARDGAGLQNITRPLRSADGSTSFVLGDFLGSGTVQILHLKENPTAGSEASANQLYVRGGQHLRPDLLQTITWPSGLVSTVASRAVLTNAGGRYVSERVAGSSAVPRQQDADLPLLVVTRTSESSGVGNGVNTVEYLYKGLKRERGRGLLGFHEVRRQSPAPDGSSTLVTVDEYLQGHPYTGSVARSRTYLAGSGTSGLLSQSGLPLLSDVSNTYCDVNSSASPAAATPAAPCAYTSVLVRPYLRQSTAAAWDLNGIALPTITTTHTYSGSYLTQTTKVVTGAGPAGQQSFTTSTANEYWPDNTTEPAWILGRVKKTTTTSTVPNSLSTTAASAGTAPKATATTGP